MTLNTAADRLAFLQQHGIRDVECIFADIAGYPRGKLMPAAKFAAGEELRIAQAIPMQAITGEYSYHPVFPDADPDVKLIPDYSTLKCIPWSSVPRAIAIHDCYELVPERAGQLCEFAARSVLKNVVARYQAHGWTPVVAPEIEFYLTASNGDPNEALRAPPIRSGRTEVGQSAFSLNLLHEHGAFWTEFRTALDALGIQSDTWIHEMGLSQYEINLLHGDPVAVADQAFLFKYAAKEIALKHNLNAVFMAKPIAGQPGSSMHLHQSIVDATGQNIFTDQAGNETPYFRQFIAGLQAAIPDVMLIFAPHVNSYRRLVPGLQAPVNMHWGYDNRTLGLRVPGSTPAARRVENRIAGSDANPYLAIAASLAAGLWGIENNLSATEALVGNAYLHAHALPRTMLASLELMESSMTARALLGERFVTAFTSVKILEHDHFLSEISPWERRYLVPQA
jgi:glutamine synthetase